MFVRYPPDDDEMSQYISGMHNEKADKVRGKKDDIFSKPLLSKSEIAKRVEALNSRAEKNQNLRQVLDYLFMIPLHTCYLDCNTNELARFGPDKTSTSYALF